MSESICSYIRWTGGMRRIIGVFGGILLAIIFTEAVGCRGRSDPPSYRVQGKGYFQGKPLAIGEIIFLPELSKGNQGPAGSAKIVNGYFDTAKGRNPIGGPHRLIVNGFDEPPNQNRDPRPLFPSFTFFRDLPKADSRLDIHVPDQKETGGSGT